MKALVIAAVALALAACAGPRSIVPNQSTIVEVRARVGTPTDIRFDKNGDELWEYATGPSGTLTWLVRFDRDGRVTETTQLLTMEQFDRILPNRTTKAEARHLLGRPSDQTFYGSGADSTWSWRMQVSPQLGYFVVNFTRDGVVRDKMVLFDVSEDGRDRGRGGGKN